MNALLFPYLNNAVKLLDAGVAPRDDIDAAMKGGCNFPMGPLELLDLVGLDTSLAILDALYAEFHDPNFAPAPLLRRMVERRAARPQDRRRASTTTAADRPGTADRLCRGRLSGTPGVGENVSVADRPWLMRTYSGHSSARASNELYRTNLAKGQTGLSVAFDLPTQTGYDPDHPLARGEVGKVGVPVPHLGEMRDALRRHPARRDEHVDDDQRHRDVAVRHVPRAGRGARRRPRRCSPAPPRTTSSRSTCPRGTYIFGPEPSRRLTVDLICHTVRHVPKWNPINVCSYHLQEAGATPVAGGRVRARDRGRRARRGARRRARSTTTSSPRSSGASRSSSNAGIRFVEEMCKLRAFGRLWDRITLERYGVTDEKLRRFRYGVQVNSLGLTEAQPENNVQRIVLETLGVTLSKDARARAVQLPAWNEALGLPRPWDQQWSLRIQQVLAYETDLLEYDDLFEGSHVVEAQDGRARRGRRRRAAVGARRRRRVRDDRRDEAAPRAEQRRAGAPHRVRRRRRSSA